MSKNKRIFIQKSDKKASLSSKLKMPMSEYSQMYRKYIL